MDSTDNLDERTAAASRGTLWCLVVLLACGCAGPRPAAPASLRVTYLANEGVLLEAGDTRVVIDGLHRHYKDLYATLPDPAREAFESAAPPWNGIDLLLVSHRHRDHFHPEAVGRHVRAAPGAHLIAPAQAVDEIAPELAADGSIRPRIHAWNWQVGRSHVIRAAGLDVTLLGLSHGSGVHADVQNVGHVFTIGGVTVLHVGDAELTADNFAPFELPARGIDIALLPWWYVASDQSRALVRAHIAPRRIVALHIGPGEAAEVVAELRASAPEVVPFVRMLEDRL
ncbi:MAG TPA: MBL fold metallo-hydrolase [Kofleriaceae bacterium]|nr:MBL fold metallo-hydrolase [Kofleriaceae bacterium]